MVKDKKTQDFKEDPNAFVGENDIDEVLSPSKLIASNFLSNRTALIGGVIFIIIVLIAILAPFITPADGNVASLLRRNLPPNAEHILGTDNTGKDIYTKIVFGARNSLVIAVLASFIATTIGSVMGAISGFYGGFVGNMIMRFTEIVMTLPYLPTLIVLSYALKDRINPDHKIFLISFIIGILGWGSLTRIVRGQMLSLREQEFMIAATALGISDRRKVFRHLLPNTFGYIVVSLMMSFAGGILAEVSLSFLGLGLPSTVPSWGNILQFAKDSNHLRNHWWMWLPCAIVVIISVVSVNMLGEGLRDAFDPKSNN